MSIFKRLDHVSIGVVDLERARRLLANPRLAAVQDLAWALINSPAFLFNH